MIDRLKILSILFLMFLIMVFVEVTLELRHFNMGYETLLFGSKKTITSGINAAQKQKIKGYGPSNEFPFRSLLIDMAAVGKTRIWIASSSHAEHNSLPAEKIFPNLICAAVNISAQCELINGSKAGMGIDGNLKLLSQYAIQYGVDYALLYQMSLIIEYQQGRIIAEQSKLQGEPTEKPLFDILPIKKQLQKTSSYQHLSDYIGGNIKLRGIQKGGLPESMHADFVKQVMQFINTTRSIGIEPVLMTFAVSHDHHNIHEMHHSVRTNFVRYNNYLSIEGWLDTIELYNDFIVEIALKNNVKLIDIAGGLYGKSEYFVDFVHFNEGGHREVARLIAGALSEFVLRSSSAVE